MKLAHRQLIEVTIVDMIHLNAREYPALLCLMAAAPGDRVLALRLAVAMVGGLIGVGPEPAIEFRVVAQGMREHADGLAAAVPPQGEPS